MKLIYVYDAIILLQNHCQLFCIIFHDAIKLSTRIRRISIISIGTLRRVTISNCRGIITDTVSQTVIERYWLKEPICSLRCRCDVTIRFHQRKLYIFTRGECYIKRNLQYSFKPGVFVDACAPVFVLSSSEPDLTLARVLLLFANAGLLRLLQLDFAILFLILREVALL